MEESREQMHAENNSDDPMQAERDEEGHQHIPQTPPQGTVFQYHPNSGYKYGRGPNLFQQMDSDDNCFARYQRKQHFWPFATREEWELAMFLIENLNQMQLDAFLKLT
ncbi:hypothetical protein SERLADRAFT_441791 [Serpula lacrymans var. lacrymans S7.9]|uniref:Uncharacterized protein n=1 Tax=Serpula lacrymans var. lacrymans (strain S7.9) TaxID=578457 RepID=F8P7N6_SERL9|nr:uncharacterized protein SERLADRAFT_441791 [Serpula lacrymans var. lacrymans S7.9]EGO20444.1 hypothetical protein SERLADRAFT_441791 [Serpula lacrymans var. lacrymans S7.9]